MKGLLTGAHQYTPILTKHFKVLQKPVLSLLLYFYMLPSTQINLTKYFNILKKTSPLIICVVNGCVTSSLVNYLLWHLQYLHDTGPGYVCMCYERQNTQFSTLLYLTCAVCYSFNRNSKLLFVIFFMYFVCLLYGSENVVSS